jgi:hypothetical protein
MSAATDVEPEEIAVRALRIPMLTVLFALLAPTIATP